MKKLINLIALVMLVSVNVLTPFTYAGDEIVENEAENVGEVTEISEDDAETPEYKEEIPENITDNSGEAEQDLQVNDDQESDFLEYQDDENTSNVLVDITESGLEKESESQDEGESEESLELEKNQESILMNVVPTNPMDIIIEATATESNQTLKINKYFANAYTVDRGDGSPVAKLTADTTHPYGIASGYTITLSLSGADRWTFQFLQKPLVSRNGTTVTGVKITYMPSLASGFGVNATAPGNYFFSSFNDSGALTSLPTGSFDTSNITTAGSFFFNSFNDNGKIISLPTGSFDTSNITTAGIYFFSAFNFNGPLTSLPDNSFRLATGLTTAGDSFFWFFNANGQLTSLPNGSFDTSNITTAGNHFFAYFNNIGGQLTSLPDNSFRLATGLTTAGDSFFLSFNENGKITSLPTGSFDTSNITTAGNSFFSAFNFNGRITSLPDNSFRLATGLTTAENNFFKSFNSYGKLTSLPTGSFDTSKITTVGDSFFSNFNSNNGAITSLPTGSFDTSKITTVGDSFFSNFNSNNGAITSLLTGSFDTSKITTVGDSFFSNFNYNGKLTSLPDSFKLSSVAYNKTNGYQNAFNSPNYTINKKVSDLVSGITVPSSDRNTFSDNQPGICGEHPNWLVNPGNACKIIYDANGGIGTTTGGYDTYSTGVVVGSGIKVPTRARYILSGWLDASGNKVEEVIFPDMDGEILYANWEELNCSDGYVVNSTGTGCVLKEYTITYNLGGGYLEDGEGNIYEGNQVVTYTYNTDTNEYDPNLNPESIKKENSQFLGWYTSEGDAFDFGIISPENGTAYAKFACNFGCVENTEKTVCEKIRVDFDATGGRFSNNSDIYSIIKSKQVFGEKTGVLHTANLDNNGNYTNEFNGQQMNGYTTSIAQYISGGITTYPISSPSIVYFGEENVEKLDVSIKYGGSPYCTPGYIIVRTGDRRQFDANYNPGNTGLAVLYIGDFPNYGENSEKSVEIDGDTFTIYQNGGCPSYGFFANISRTQIVDLIYEEGAFDNIPEPTREGHKFVGWYLSDDTEFNTGNVSTGEITKVYAKRECADGYENKGGECVKKSSGSSGGGGGGGGGGGSSSSSSTGSNTSDATPSQGAGTGANSSTGTQNDQTTTGTNINEPEGTGNNAEIQTGSQVDSNTGSIVSSGTNVNNPDTETSNDSTTSPQNDDKSYKTYSTEFQQAYEFAKGNGITTMPTIQKANMEGKLTRIAMAKMLSQYAMNVLGQKPANVVAPKFNDVTDKQNSDYDDGVTLAYQLGIMGQNMPNNNFRPNDEVTRAEFATALSRMAYGTSDGEYKATSKYYIHHMEKLVKEGIITKDDPNMKELRGYVMIMLMRSAK